MRTSDRDPDDTSPEPRVSGWRSVGEERWAGCWVREGPAKIARRFQRRV